MAHSQPMQLQALKGSLVSWTQIWSIPGPGDLPCFTTTIKTVCLAHAQPGARQGPGLQALAEHTVVSETGAGVNTGPGFISTLIQGSVLSKVRESTY
jgi:hypothetical protein